MCPGIRGAERSPWPLTETGKNTDRKVNQAGVGEDLLHRSFVSAPSVFSTPHTRRPQLPTVFLHACIKNIDKPQNTRICCLSPARIDVPYGGDKNFEFLVLLISRQSR
jgi:hypothetical protein